MQSNNWLHLQAGAWQPGGKRGSCLAVPRMPAAAAATAAAAAAAARRPRAAGRPPRAATAAALAAAAAAAAGGIRRRSGARRTSGQSRVRAEGRAWGGAEALHSIGMGLHLGFPFWLVARRRRTSLPASAPPSALPPRPGLIRCLARLHAGPAGRKSSSSWLSRLLSSVKLQQPLRIGMSAGRHMLRTGGVPSVGQLARCSACCDFRCDASVPVGSRCSAEHCHGHVLDALLARSGRPLAAWAGGAGDGAGKGGAAGLRAAAACPFVSLVLPDLPQDDAWPVGGPSRLCPRRRPRRWRSASL